MGANSFIRIVKIGKLYKILRLIRMIKVLKLMKNQSFLNKASEHLKISSGSERLISFSVGFTLLIHISACLYIFLGHLTESSYPAWTDD